MYLLSIPSRDGIYGCSVDFLGFVASGWGEGEIVLLLYRFLQSADSIELKQTIESGREIKSDRSAACQSATLICDYGGVIIRLGPSFRLVACTRALFFRSRHGECVFRVVKDCKIFVLMFAQGQGE